MSGGAFGYSQKRIDDIIEVIKHEIDTQGQQKLDDEIYGDDDMNYPIESEVVNKIYRDAIYHLTKAKIYAQRIDWYLSGDDGEESMIDRLQEDMDNR